MGTIVAAPTQVPGPDACCSACLAQKGGCVAWTFVTATSNCFLKNSTGAPLPDPGVVSGTPPSPCALQQGVNSMGVIMAPPQPAADPGACCGLCVSNATCAGFTWTAASSKCFLKSSLGTPVADAGVVRGTRPAPGGARCAQ